MAYLADSISVVAYFDHSTGPEVRDFLENENEYRDRMRVVGAGLTEFLCQQRISLPVEIPDKIWVCQKELALSPFKPVLEALEQARTRILNSRTGVLAVIFFDLSPREDIIPGAHLPGSITAAVRHLNPRPNIGFTPFGKPYSSEEIVGTAIHETLHSLGIPDRCKDDSCIMKQGNLLVRNICSDCRREIREI